MHFRTLLCSDDNIINGTECVPCPEKYRPSKANKTGKYVRLKHRNPAIHIKLIHSMIRLVCELIPTRQLHWYYLQSLVSLSFSFIGITLTLITTFIFVKHRETPVVKSSTRELCYIMLLGMIIAHGIPIVIVWQPSVFICSVVKTVPVISFTIIYSALLVKTNRIARILAISKHKFPKLNPRFISLEAQVPIYWKSLPALWRNCDSVPCIFCSLSSLSLRR